MSLVKCPQCQSFYSSNITKCPKCGHINGENTQSNKGKIDDEEDYWRKNCNSIQGLHSYKHLYPYGRHIQECNSLLRQYNRLSNRADLKETWHVIKAIVKYGGLTICAILAIVVIIVSIKTRTWPVAGTVGPIYLASYYLDKWEI